MEKRILLAFAGKMYTGKDTSADIWSQHYNNYVENNTLQDYRGYDRIAFADDIKRICKNTFGLTDDDVNTPEGKKRTLSVYGKTVRELLQGIGEGLRNTISPDIWVITTMMKIDRLLANGKTHLLVTDVRYPNELSALKSRGFTVIKLIRDTGIVDAHPSEKDLNDKLFDYVIDNNGTIADLEEKLLQLPEYQHGI